MASINITSFYKSNIIDTCSIWNLISSQKLFSVSISAGCVFNCTDYVIYECFHKKRKGENKEETELKFRLGKYRKEGFFINKSFSIANLQDINILESRKRLSKGELSSMVYAKVSDQAFLTDDQQARRLAASIIEEQDKIQTIPKLFGWLFYSEQLIDSDKDTIINDHKSFKRSLEKYFNEVYKNALALRLAKTYGNIEKMSNPSAEPAK